jgi:group I intron endonuclease
MHIYTIYRITNHVNGKVYIGFTSKQPKERWKQHRRIRNCPDQNSYSILHAALSKYGVKNFTFEVIYQSLDGEHCLKVKEPDFIREHDCCVLDGADKGYNVTRGGESGMRGKKHTEESKAKMREAKLGKPGKGGRIFSEEDKARLSALNKGVKFDGERLERYIASREKVKKLLVVGDKTYKGVLAFCKTFRTTQHSLKRWLVAGKASLQDGTYTFSPEIETYLLNRLNGNA